jgi:hypothetical protein
MFFNNKFGQVDMPIVSFVILVAGLIFFAPIMLKVFHVMQPAISNGLSNNTGAAGIVAAANFNSVMNPLVNWWDKIMVFIFFIAVILLLVSSFLVDTHPFWIILYIVIAFFLVLITPNIMSAASTVYNNPSFVVEGNQLSFFTWIINNFGYVLVGLFVLTGIIMYGKVALFPSRGGGVLR